MGAEYAPENEAQQEWMRQLSIQSPCLWDTVSHLLPFKIIDIFFSMILKFHTSQKISVFLLSSLCFAVVEGCHGIKSLIFRPPKIGP